MFKVEKIKKLKKILIPLPGSDFDPSEVAITWSILNSAGHTVYFATPDGKKAHPDKIMLTGKGLGIFKPFLRADKNARAAYAKLEKDYNFNNPIKYSSIKHNDYNALFLPGGHAKGVKGYLESKILQDITGKFFFEKKPVAAICHGVLIIARAKNQKGKSLLYGRKTTALIKSGELTAWRLTRLWMGDYYRTYPDTTTEDEVIASLKTPEDFLTGPSLLFRDSMKKLNRGFVVQDGNYISGRWPGDAHRLGIEFLKLLDSNKSKN